MAEIKKGAISLVVTLVLLFGSFFAYKWFYIERSIVDLIEHTPSVELKEIEVRPRYVAIKIGIPQKSLVHYPKLYQVVQKEAGGREVRLNLEDRPNALLLETWSEAAFGVKEGIAQQRYTLVPKSVAEIAARRKVDYEVLMDESMICITLRQGEHYLYRVFDLSKTKGGETIG